MNRLRPAALALLLSLCPPAAAAAPKPVTIIMDQMVFKPRHVTVRVGTVVRWFNVDRTRMQHNVVADDGTFDSGRLLRDRESYRWVADRPGRFPYSCTIHYGMDGTLTVTSD